MSNSPAPASRVADYFFVAGLNDVHLIPSFEHAKKFQQTSDSDVFYYKQQEQAVANTSHLDSPEKDSFSVDDSPPLIRSDILEEATSVSLLGVLDHVQSVIDNFDKERESVREGVITAQDPKQNYAEKYTRSNSEKTITQENYRSKSFRNLNTSKLSIRSSSRQWRSPSDPKQFDFNIESIKSEPPTPVENETIPNIFDIKYTPTVLMRYPKSDTLSNGPFPSYAAMFCFPKDIQLYCGDAPPPPERFHSFTITDESGLTLYGSCIVFYEKLADKLKKPVDQAIKSWSKANMEASAIEYSEHLKSKLLAEKAQLEKLKYELSQTVNLNRNDRFSQHARLEEAIRACHENITVYRELLEPVKMGICTSDDVWVPKSIGLLGQMPWLSLYSDWLKILLDNIVGVAGIKNTVPTIDIESTVINFIDEVPLPPPGRFEIGLTINRRPLFFSRPPINQVPILKDFSLYPLFRALSPHLILAILETLLAEGKVIFLSQYPGMLSIACESFRYLLFPFYWQFVFIPVLPERLLTCLQAPVPYIIGFMGTMDELEGYAPDDACIINLDSNSMHQSERSMPIPDRQRRKLQATLELYAPLHTKYKIPYGVPHTVQCVYPKGKMMLNCSRSKIADVFIAKPTAVRDSESSDNTSIWSASVISKPSGFWSSNASTRSSNDSSHSTPQFPGSAMLSAHSPPIRPVPSIQSIQSSLSTSSLNTPKSRAPTPIINSNQQPYKTYRPSEPIKTSTHDSSKNKLSEFISKPKNIFHTGESYSDTMTSPHISVTSPQYNQNFDLPRYVKHIEGHLMAEIFKSELVKFHGYRCVCGKPVNEEEDHQVKMFMCCQECQLVTHDVCTDQILHPCLPTCFNEKKVHEGFIRMFASLFYNYRTGFMDGSDDKAGSSITAHDDSNKRNLVFSKDKFIKQSDKDSREFLTNLINSQMFTQFITDRILKSSQEPEILVFDEYIKLKLNRSKLKLVKDNTPFLNDQSYKVSQIIWSTPPSEPIVQQDYKRFPTHLQFLK